MSTRDAILERIRRACGAEGGDRASAVRERLKGTPSGVIPARGQRTQAAKVKLFCQKAEEAAATVTRIKNSDAVPKTIAQLLRRHNLPARIRMGADKRLATLPWSTQKALEVNPGASDGDDEAGVSHAFAGAAETGTLLLTSGPDNPTTINFLPDHHVVVVNAADIEGDYETVFAMLRKAYGKGAMPRTVNFITGPSRSADIEQTLILGAHGPRALHIIVVGG